MKKIFRAITLAAAAVMTVASVAAFAGCDTNEPEVAITYEFNNKKYEVVYVLTRKGAPQTVQHFIELADAGYYDGTIIHDYQSNGVFLYGGGYTLDEEKNLVEKDYWTEVKNLEQEKGIQFTQTVFTNEDKDVSEPLYTVHGEFKNNGVSPNSKSYKQNRAGTLVMYYMNKGSDSTRVATIRSDGGENNDGEPYQMDDKYVYNSATSLFYTFTSDGDRTELDADYCAFGRTKNFEDLKALLDAVKEFSGTLADDASFTEERTVILNQYDPFPLVQSAKIPATYNTPIDNPITVVSVRVKKY